MIPEDLKKYIGHLMHLGILDIHLVPNPNPHCTKVKYEFAIKFTRGFDATSLTELEELKQFFKADEIVIDMRARGDYKFYICYKEYKEVAHLQEFTDALVDIVELKKDRDKRKDKHSK